MFYFYNFKSKFFSFPAKLLKCINGTLVVIFIVYFALSY